MSDYNLRITVRSDRIIKAITDMFGTQAEMARKTGVSYQMINRFVCMREKPFTSKGWSKDAEDLATALGVYPSDLWPEHMREVILARSTAEVSMSEAEVLAVMSDDKSMERKQVISMAMRCLTPRYKLAVVMLNNGATLDEIGGEINVSRERARQITLKGMRNMKRQLHKDGFRDILDVL